MDGKEVEAFYEAHDALYNFLLAKGEVTFASDANDNFRRSLILAVASYFEAVITSIVKEVPRRHSKSNPFICGLIDQKVIPRQYHTYFAWDKRNANSFFKLFGDLFYTKATQDVKNNPKLEQAIRDFLDLGETRNKLVHINFIAYDVDKTPSDIIKQFRSALYFVKYLDHELLGLTEEEAIDLYICS